MQVQVVVHESFEGPGLIETWARTRGHALDVCRLYDGDPLPSGHDLDLLVVMGGPQSTRTTVEECPYFDAEAERRLIGSCVARGAAVVGVCLGAQLLGDALGAPPEPSPQPEIGAFPVTLTDAGLRDPLLAGLPPTFQAGHWHAEMPGLTPDAAVLATSAGCPRQVVAYGPLVYGLQLHLELAAGLIADLIAHSEQQLRALDGLPFIHPATLRQVDWSPMHDCLTAFLDRLSAQVGRVER